MLGVWLTKPAPAVPAPAHNCLEVGGRSARSPFRSTSETILDSIFTDLAEALLLAKHLPIITGYNWVDSRLLQFDLIAVVAKIFTPLVAAVTSVAHLVGVTIAIFQRPTVSKIPVASPLTALRTPNLLDGLSGKQLDGIRTRLLNEAAIREDNASALKTIDKRFGIERSAKTEYQDFKAIRPH